MPATMRVRSLYRLRSATIGIRNEHNKWVTVTMPEDALLEVAQENAADGTVEVLWDDKCVRMFAVDLQERGNLVQPSAQKAGASE
jgi:hypothetical protein